MQMLPALFFFEERWKILRHVKKIIFVPFQKAKFSCTKYVRIFKKPIFTAVKLSWSTVCYTVVFFFNFDFKLGDMFDIFILYRIVDHLPKEMVTVNQQNFVCDLILRISRFYQSRKIK